MPRRATLASPLRGPRSLVLLWLLSSVICNVQVYASNERYASLVRYWLEKRYRLLLTGAHDPLKNAGHIRYDSSPHIRSLIASHPLINRAQARSSPTCSRS